MRIVEKNIEWLVVISVVYVTTYEVLRAAFSMIGMGIINGITIYFILFLLFLLFIYQNHHYGYKIHGRPFMFFFTIYCIYILGDMTVFRKYPLDEMFAVPDSVFHYFRNLFMSIGYLLCAEIIVRHFNIRKYVVVSVVICTLPSLLYIQYVGMDAIQMGEVGHGDEEFLSNLTIGFTNSPILVICLYNWKKLFSNQLLSFLFSSLIIVLIAFVLVAVGKRGPILSTIVNIMICIFLIKRQSLKRYLFFAFIVTFFMYLNYESIIDSLKDFSPKTGDKIEASISEGDTSGRLDYDHPETSTFLIGLNNFTSSPIWGNYFRLVTNYSHYRGCYPHNVFIEILMTMGIIGFVPFMLLLWKAYLNSSFIFKRKYSANQLVFLILFLSSFLMLQTSKSIVFRTDFWLPFYILFILNKLKLNNNNKIQLKKV